MASLTGFIGLGLMGEPIALNMARAGVPLVVWNRTANKCRRAVQAGASRVATVDEVFTTARHVFLMLSDEDAVDDVLGRGTHAFSSRVANHVLINMGTFSPEYSVDLSDEIQAAGGRYVEAPVSGSRKPAENGDLVVMLAGAEDDVAGVQQYIEPVAREQIACGAVPAALRLKLAVNLFLITMVTGLTEAFHFAAEHGLELNTFTRALDTGPMASPVSRTKAQKLLVRDFRAQASVRDVLKNNRLIAEAARAKQIASPLLDQCYRLYAEAVEQGHAEQDMAAVIAALESRTSSTPGRPSTDQKGAAVLADPRLDVSAR